MAASRRPQTGGQMRTESALEARAADPAESHASRLVPGNDMDVDLQKKKGGGLHQLGVALVRGPRRVRRRDRLLRAPSAPQCPALIQKVSSSTGPGTTSPGIIVQPQVADMLATCAR